MEIELGEIARPPAPAPTLPARVIPAGGGGWIADRIADGDRLRGSSRGEMTTIADTQAFAADLREVAARAERLMVACGSDRRAAVEAFGIDLPAYAAVAAFGEFQRERMPVAAGIGSASYGMSLSDEASVSDAVEAGRVRCLDIAIVAQAFMQQMGIECVLVGGSTRRPGSGAIDGHAFLILNQTGHRLVWDPTNPIPTASGGHRPALYDMPAAAADRLLSGAKVLEACPLVYHRDYRVEFGATDNGDFI